MERLLTGGSRDSAKRCVPLLLTALVVATGVAAGCGGRVVVDHGAATDTAVPAVVGPPGGALVLAGGGAIGPEIMGRFLELAGGRNAPIVLIPTANAVDGGNYDADTGLGLLRAAGARNITVLHAATRYDANSDEFVEAIRGAAGVWFLGGRQWRLVDAYLNTRVHEELNRLLARGGVIGGSSAGASIQASFLIRGAKAGNHIVVDRDYQEGFGFLKDVAVDQHLLARGRQDDLVDVIAERPHLLGIGLDEGTAIVVRGDTFEVIGASKVAVYQARLEGGEVKASYRFLEPGDRYDMRARTPLD